MNALCDPSSCYEKMRCLFHNRENLAPASECSPVLSRGDGFSMIVRAAFLCTVVFLCRFCWTWFNTSCSNFSIKGICRSIASRHLPQKSEIGSFSMRSPTPFFWTRFWCSSVCLEIQYGKLHWERLQSPQLIPCLSKPKDSCEGEFIPCLSLHLVRSSQSETSLSVPFSADLQCLSSH